MLTSNRACAAFCGRSGALRYESCDQRCQLIRDRTGITHCLLDTLGIQGPTAPMARDLAFDQPAESEARWRRSEGGSVGRQVSSLTWTRAMRLSGAAVRGCA